MHDVPHFRIAVAFARRLDERVSCLSRACIAEPGARFEIVPVPGAALPTGDLHAVVCAEDVPDRLPDSFRRITVEASARGVPVLVEGPDLESVPRRVRLSAPLPFVPRTTTPPPAQRSLALDELAGRSLVRLPPRGPTVTLERVPLGVRLAARDDMGGTRALVATLDALGLRVLVDDREPPTRRPHVEWLALGASLVDAFSRFADDIAGPEGTPRALLEPLVRRARVWLARAMPPHARALARTFHPELRAFVAFHVAQDATGRIAQIARACPGLVTFSREACTWRAGALARRAIVRGEQQKRVLAHCLDSWVEHYGYPLSRARQEAFIRRAGPRVLPGDLSVPVADGVLLDDVPSDARTNARWFRAIAAFSSIDFGRDATVASLAPFVSARGVALGELDALELEQLLRRLATRGEELRRWPSRKTSLDAARASVRLWPEEEIVLQRPSIRFPSPPDPSLQVRRLATTVELAAEGEQMHHCVATYTDAVLRGRTQVFSASFREERLTLAIDVYARRPRRAHGARRLRKRRTQRRGASGRRGLDPAVSRDPAPARGLGITAHRRRFRSRPNKCAEPGVATSRTALPATADQAAFSSSLHRSNGTAYSKYLSPSPKYASLCSTVRSMLTPGQGEFSVEND